MTFIDVSKLNWATGLNRVYNTGWAVLCIIALIHLFTGFSIGLLDWVLATIAVGVLPFITKKTIVWIYNGFIK